MAHYLFTHESDYTVAAFCVDGEYIDKPVHRGLPVVAWEELHRAYPPEDHDIFVAIGIERINQLRAGKTKEIRESGYRLASFLSPRTKAPDGFVIKPNVMIMDNVGLHPYVEIGEDTIVWSHSRLALKCRIGPHCWITSATLGEQVHIGESTFIGLNATIAPMISIGKRCLIGAGALVMRNADDFSVFKGPASKPSEIPSTSPLWKI